MGLVKSSQGLSGLPGLCWGDPFQAFWACSAGAALQAKEPGEVWAAVVIRVFSFTVQTLQHNT